MVNTTLQRSMVEYPSSFVPFTQRQQHAAAHNPKENYPMRKEIQSVKSEFSQDPDAKKKY